ncbi:hypothetical protein QR77_20640, partial [Streptomyces sp. 150FB]
MSARHTAVRSALQGRMRRVLGTSAIVAALAVGGVGAGFAYADSHTPTPVPAPAKPAPAKPV